MSLLLPLFAASMVVFVMADEVTTPACVEIDSEIVVGFENENNAESGDWLGLYPAEAVGVDTVPGMPTLHPMNWIFSCGQRSCSQPSVRGPVLFEKPRFSLNADGSDRAWVAVLARDDGQGAPYTIVHRSSPFLVSADCSAPVPAETSDPTEHPTEQPTRNPTNPPTANPTEHPTMKPTPQPQGASTSKRTYAFREEIVVNFNMEDPEGGDWIGIYDENFSVSKGDDAGEALFWVWNCGNTGNSPSCGSRSTGSVSIDGERNDWGMEWPPIPGNYKAVILRDAIRSNWEVVDVSPVFTVAAPTVLDSESLSLVRRDLETLITNNITLAAKFLRLSFHDCTGGCDGCVDLDEIKNRGLELPISELQPIVDKYDALLSRADVWAMSALVGADVSQPRNGFRVDFEFDSWGRRNCEDIYEEVGCFNKDGDEVICDQRHGPAHFIPGINIHTQDLFQFFDDEFNFSQKEGVAIMGAHTLGQLARENSGVGGPHGWLLENRLLDNEYYIELVGGRSIRSPLNDLINDAPAWVRHFESNSDKPEFDDHHIWLGTPEGPEGRLIVMLNADIAVVRDLNDDNMDESGEVHCAFVERDFISDPVCPHAEGALQRAAEYRFDNALWLRDFSSTLRKMVRNGYRMTTRECKVGNGVCRLRWNR